MNSQMSDELDLKALILTIWADRKKVLLGTGAAFFIAVIYAFVIAKPTFISTALLVPTEQPSADQLGAAAALLGKKSAGMGDLDLYQSLLTSRVVLSKMLNTPMRNEHDTALGRIEPLFIILGIDSSNRIQWEKSLGKLSKNITVGSKETGVGGILEVRVEARFPWLAQQMCDYLLLIGQEELRAVRRDRYSVILASLTSAVQEARVEWDTAASLHASFLETNRSNQLPFSVLSLARLEMEKAAKEQKYLLARREMETQKLEQAKAAPPMVVLDSANLPAKKAKPKRIIIIVAITILGSLTSIASILVRIAFK